MSQILLFSQAPDFTLQDLEGNQVRLSDFRGKNNVFLVFNRGFT
jgi:peroxiredoxin